MSLAKRIQNFNDGDVGEKPMYRRTGTSAYEEPTGKAAEIKQQIGLAVKAMQTKTQVEGHKVATAWRNLDKGERTKLDSPTTSQHALEG